MRHLACSFAMLLLLLPSTAAAQPSACVLRGVGELPHVRVAPRGAEPFELHLTGGRAVEVRAQGHGRAHVRARGLVFEGTMEASAVPIALAHEIRVAGVLTLRAGTALSPVELRAPRVAVDLAAGARIASLPIPCDALIVGPTADAPDERPADAPTEGALLSNGPRLRVHDRPDGRAIVIEVTELRLAQIERRPGWIRVRHDFDRGSTLEGWVREADVRAVPSEPFAAIGDDFGFGGLGLCGHGASHAYMGPATLLRGGELRTARDGPVWARAEEDVPLQTVEIVWNDGWAQVVRVEGIEDYEGCANELDQAWVEVSSLRFPPGARGVDRGSPPPPR